MENSLQILTLAALMAFGMWLLLKRGFVKSPEPDWRKVLVHWAKTENLPELLALVEGVEQLEPRLKDRAHFRIQYAGQEFNITVFANGSVQDADRLALSLR